MKTAALVITLLLHATGLWDNTPESMRDKLTDTASSSTPSAVPIAGAVSSGPLAFRIGNDPLRLSAAGVIAVDANTGTVLYSQDAGKRVPIASLSKLATALVIMSRHSTDEVVTIPKLPDYDIAAQGAGLVTDENYRLGDLMRATLVHSANDAAEALAIYDSGDTTKFSARMNNKMTEWGIKDTRFSTPSGLKDEDNNASAESLAKIAQLALTNPFIRETVGKSEVTITSAAGRVITLPTTNKLLASGKFYGIKTGYTPAAGECFVGLTRIQGHEVITVVLGATDRFGATQTLANWIDRNWQWL